VLTRAEAGGEASLREKSRREWTIVGERTSRSIVRWLQLWHARGASEQKRFAKKRFLEASRETSFSRHCVALNPRLVIHRYEIVQRQSGDVSSRFPQTSLVRVKMFKLSREDFSLSSSLRALLPVVPSSRFSTLISMKSVAAAAANIVPVERDRANGVSQVRPGDWSIVQTHRELLYYRCKYARTIPLVYPTRMRKRAYARTFPRRDKTQSRRTDGRTDGRMSDRVV